MAIGEPQQIGRMEIAQHPGRRRFDRGRQRLAPQREENRAPALRGRRSHVHQIPVEQQLDLDQERIHIVLRQLVVEMRRTCSVSGSRRRCSDIKHIEGGLVARLDRRRRIARDDALFAEILHDDQSQCRVGLQDHRRRKIALAQGSRERHVRNRILGQMSDGAVGLAVAHRRTVGMRRRIHQHHGIAVEGQPLENAR